MLGLPKRHIETEKPSFETTVHDEGLEDIVSSTVRAPYRGTAVDKHNMRVQGKQQQRLRNFKFVTMAAFASMAVISCEFLLALSTFNLVDGGTALLFWGFIVVSCGMLMLYAGIAEMASMSARPCIKNVEEQADRACSRSGSSTCEFSMFVLSTWQCRTQPDRVITDSSSSFPLYTPVTAELFN